VALQAVVLIAAAFAQPNGNWEVGVVTSYLHGGDFDGPGIAVQSLSSPSDHFAFGAMVDVARLSAGSLTAGNGQPASYAFTSTLAGGMVQLRLALRPVEPFAALGVGYVAVSGQQSVNAQCGLGSGFGGLLAVGGRAAVSDHLTVGLRGAARSSSMTVTCAAAFGPAGFDVALLVAVGGTLDYRW
jgi:hypothetical protein